MSHGPDRFHSLLHSADLLDKRLATLLMPLGMRPRQARILNALDRMGEVSQVALADAFDVTSGSMSTMIDRMLVAGLISRRKNPADGRGELVSVTERGRAALAEVRDVWREMDELIEKALGPGKAAQLSELTRELKVALGGKVVASREGAEAAQRATREETRRHARRRAQNEPGTTGD